MLFNRSFAGDVDLNDGNHLLDKCSKLENIDNLINENAGAMIRDSNDIGYCLGLIRGTYMSLEAFADESKFCPPES